jgi:hypothetical protein
LQVDPAEGPDQEAEAEDKMPNQVRKSRKSRVIADDEDEDVDEHEDMLKVDDHGVSSTDLPGTATVAEEQDDPFAAFGFGAAKTDANAMSATQAFNATVQALSQDTQDDSFDILRHVPPPSSFIAPPTLPDMDSQILAEDSQTQLAIDHNVDEGQGVQLNWETQGPKTPGPALVRKAIDLTEAPDGCLLRILAFHLPGLVLDAGRSNESLPSCLLRTRNTKRRQQSSSAPAKA